ncbi:energy transducer TonB [uncultured Aquimarina sp.]|uniref:energy transducer TonB n=1 Tax=uncultured Aquimarina sp. TaxID=575652 RepID=UPI002619786F|nr:energy transducer TonB [uncultured Aquimarina sp.]
MSNKHDANVRKSTLLNFQIGLIASLLFVFVMFEMYTSVSVVKPPDIGSTKTVDTVFTLDVFKIEQKPKKKEVVKTKRVKKPDFTKPEVVDNNSALQKLKKELEGADNDVHSKAVSIDSIIDVGETEKIIYDIDKVTVAPIYPGCEKFSSNDERIACFSGKIRRLVSNKFNAGLGEVYGLKGLQRIHVQFQVDTDGVIKEVQVRAPHPALEKEARRVVKKFSSMEPGKIGNKPVKVNYILPITFKVVD